MTAGPITLRGEFVRTRTYACPERGCPFTDRDPENVLQHAFREHPRAGRNPGLWDPQPAIEARDDAMLRVQAKSAPWAAVAMDAVRHVAADNQRLSAEDVWVLLDRWNIPRPTEPRAMGPVMSRAVKDGLIRPDGYSRGTDPRHHRDIPRVYRSLLT